MNVFLFIWITLMFLIFVYNFNLLVIYKYMEFAHESKMDDFSKLMLVLSPVTFVFLSMYVLFKQVQLLTRKYTSNMEELITLTVDRELDFVDSSISNKIYNPEEFYKLGQYKLMQENLHEFLKMNDILK